MAEQGWAVRDEVWEAVEPLLPPRAPQTTGPPRVPDRTAFNAIVFVSLTGIAWRHLPRELGVSPATAHRRLQDWERAGVWSKLHAELLRRLNGAGQSTGPTRWSTAATSALFKGALTGPSPVDHGRTGSKHHLIVDAHGIPLAATLTGGNRNDVTQLLPLVDGVGPVRGKPGRPRHRAETLIADRGYDHDQYRRSCGAAGSSRSSPAARTEHGSGLGRLRWVIERTFAWLHNFRRLRTRYKRRAELHQAFLDLGCAIICQRFLRAF